MRLGGGHRGTAAADAADGAEVVIEGWLAPVEVAPAHAYFFLVPDPVCCLGCLPSDPLACVEVYATAAIPPQPGPVRLAGRWRRLVDDPAGWRYRLDDARWVGAAGAPAVSRRRIIVAGTLLPLAACAPAPPPGRAPDGSEAASALPGDAVTVDIHSHAGRIARALQREDSRFAEVAAPMRDGGMAAACLAIVADTPVTRVMPDRRIAAVRTPEPGELSKWGFYALDRLEELIRQQGLRKVTDAASLRAARTAGPSVVVSAEGADFLEGSLDRLEAAHRQHGLRHLQLTHYRVNELGDIQTEAPVHGGLTAFGAEVIRACNRHGIVVDVAHGTFDLVRRAAAVTTKPLVLSHTSLSVRPGPRSRLISPDHARAVAETGGVIGIWPPSTVFHDLPAMARGMARMADVVGPDHVGLGSDMLGLTSPSVFASYRDLPLLASELRATGFSPEETGKILGGNYVRVFAATVG